MNTRRYGFGCLTAVGLITHAVVAHAAFFQLAENSPAGLGNAFAGGAAIAEDASTVWYNPAGLARLSGTQLVAGVHAINPSLEFSKSSATTILGSTLTGGNGGDAGESAVVPNLYLSHRIDEQMVFGLGINVPFGLATDYQDNWVGRYYADRSDIKTVNINPALSYRASDQISLGFGINYQKIEAELGQWADLGTICALKAPGSCAALGLVPQQSDAKVVVKADDQSYGYNLGFLWEQSKETRIGLAYRSAIKHKLTGLVDVTTYSAGQALFASNPLLNLVDGGAHAYVTLPATLSISGYIQPTSQWALMGDITRTYWSELPELRIYFDGGAADSVVTLNLKDVYRYSLGANYSPSGSWTYRAGIALDQTPSPNDAVRTPRLPDANRKWFSLGAGYKSSDQLKVDFALTHIKVDDATIAKNALDSENNVRGNLYGKYTNSINILSAQLNWLF